MTMTRGYDYSQYIPPAKVKAAGAGFVILYVGDPTWPKSATAPECAALLADGIAIAFVYETISTWMLGGPGTGMSAGAQAREWARAIGAPDTTRIIAAADFDVQQQQVSVVMATLGGFAENAGLTGLYGGLLIVRIAADAGWRTMQTGAWSHGVWDPRAQIRQGGQTTIGGVTVDVDEANGLDGFWTKENTIMAKVPDTIAHHFAGLDLTNDFTPGNDYTVEIAAIWGDARAEACYRLLVALTAKVDALAAKPDAA
jgi:Domain of unknown function (DUF1906)